ncbi:hypothetical protein QT882_15285, partial [Xanthomonas fragariae]|nr:hypothetical protein [Xanthomonas fragariae]MDM7589950.1 hypothetical protein [Xanthomonas fragariae]
QPALAAALDRVFACLDAGDGMVILECRAAVTDGTWRLKGIFQGRRNIQNPNGRAKLLLVSERRR